MKARDVIAAHLEDQELVYEEWANRHASTIIAALESAGLCIVPREATPEMIHNADIVVDVAGEGEFRIAAYRDGE